MIPGKGKRVVLAFPDWIRNEPDAERKTVMTESEERESTMVKMTCAEAAKLLKKLYEELNSVMLKEEHCKDFLAALGEDPENVRPKYDYETTSSKIGEIKRKIWLLKHAINEFNTTTIVPGTEQELLERSRYFRILSRQN